MPWVKATSLPGLAIWVTCLGLAGGCALNPSLAQESDDGTIVAGDADAASADDSVASPSEVIVVPTEESDSSSDMEVVSSESGSVRPDKAAGSASSADESFSTELTISEHGPAEAGAAASPVNTIDSVPAAASDASAQQFDSAHDQSIPDADTAAAAGFAVGAMADDLPEVEADEPANQPAATMDSPGPQRVDPCTQYDPEYDTWLDRSQMTIYQTVCGATAWFDGFFGDRRFDQVTGQTYGRISLGGYWDQRNGFDPRLRFRARFALPALRERSSALLFGRGDEQDVIEERNTSRGDETPVVPGSNQNENVSTFVGFGWDRLTSLTRSLSFSAGLRLRSPIEPILKVKYRRNWQLTERDLLSIRPLAYWRSEEGFGSTVQLDVDHVINSAFLFRWANFANVSESEEVEGVDWGTTFYLFQALSEKQALTYSIFAKGETDAPITFKNAGFEFRYRQRILRKWLFIEYRGGISWPRYLPEEERKANFGSGLRLEAYFGPAPDDWMR